MCVISKEELIKDSKQIVELDILKSKLEGLFCSESSTSIKFQEDCNEIIVLLESLIKTQDLKIATLKLHESAISVTNLADKYCNVISEGDYEKLVGVSNRFELWANLFDAMFKIDKNLTDNSSLETLKKWSKWIELFVQILDSGDKLYSVESLVNVENLAKKIIEVTFIKIKNSKQTTKNHYKIFLKTSAEFILSKIEDNKSATPWKIVVGKKSYQELLVESQRKINSLNDLDPKSNEEAKIQLDTLDYVEKHLKC